MKRCVADFGDSGLDELICPKECPECEDWQDADETTVPEQQEVPRLICYAVPDTDGHGYEVYCHHDAVQAARVQVDRLTKALAEVRSIIIGDLSPDEADARYRHYQGAMGDPMEVSLLVREALEKENKDTVPPADGGCWYCHRAGGDDLVFSLEFDTNVHLACIQKARQDDPEDPEAQILAHEFNLSKEEDPLPIGEFGPMFIQTLQAKMPDIKFSLDEEGRMIEVHFAPGEMWGYRLPLYFKHYQNGRAIDKLQYR